MLHFTVDRIAALLHTDHVADNKTVSQQAGAEETTFTTIEIPKTLHTRARMVALKLGTTLRQLVLDSLNGHVTELESNGGTHAEK